MGENSKNEFNLMPMTSRFKFGFEDLEMYHKALEFGELVNKQIATFPKEEIYRLSSQYIRAADSIALNIAEGSFSSDANFNRYLQIAWDSSHECVVCSTKAFMRGYIDSDTNENNRTLLTEIGKMITSYKNYLKRKMREK